MREGIQVSDGSTIRRLTKNDILFEVALLNRELGTEAANQPGYHYLMPISDTAGWKLVETINHGGGVRDVLNIKISNRHDAYNAVRAYRMGLMRNQEIGDLPVNTRAHLTEL
jgi:hypothetical protein